MFTSQSNDVHRLNPWDVNARGVSTAAPIPQEDTNFINSSMSLCPFSQQLAIQPDIPCNSSAVIQSTKMNGGKCVPLGSNSRWRNAKAGRSSYIFSHFDDIPPSDDWLGIKPAPWLYPLSGLQWNINGIQKTNARNLVS